MSACERYLSLWEVIVGGIYLHMVGVCWWDVSPIIYVWLHRGQTILTFGGMFVCVSWHIVSFRGFGGLQRMGISLLFIIRVAPCTLARCDYFVAIFQVAQNRLKFGMSTLFVLKNVCSRVQKNMDKIAWNSTPSTLPLLLSVSKQRRISILENQNTVRVSFTLLEGRGGGWLSRTCLKPCFPACGTKNAGTFFHRKGVGMPKFIGFWATWKIATK